MTWRQKIIIGSAVALVVLILLPVRAHYRAKGALAAYKQQLLTQGEKLTIEELIPPPPTNGPNGAIALVGAANRLALPYNEHSPRAMKYVSPGRAVVGWRQETLPLKNGYTNPWPQLRLEVEANREAMNEIRIALANPAINFDLDYHHGLGMSLQHLGSTHRVSQWFAAATLLELYEGHADAAWENLRTTIAVTRCLADEPLVVSQLVRSMTLQTAFIASWEILQFPGWKDEQFAELQSVWQATQPLQSMSACLEMDRALSSDVYEKCRQAPERIALLLGTSSLSLSKIGVDIVEDPKAGFADLAEKFHRRWMWPLWTSYTNEIWRLQCQQAILTGVRLAEKNYAFVPALKLVNQNLAQIGSPEHVFIFKDNDASKRVITEIAQSETMRQLLVTAIALKRHQLRHGKLPVELSALVPEFLPTIPLDFMDGKPLRYRPLPDGQFLLYSIGTDGEDNGGDATQPKDKERPHWFDGRDWVWPLPAEIEADNAAQRQKQPR